MNFLLYSKITRWVRLCKAPPTIYYLYNERLIPTKKCFCCWKKGGKKTETNKEVEEIKYIFSSLFASCRELSDGKRVPHSVTSSHNTASSRVTDFVVQFQEQMWFEFLHTWARVPTQAEGDAEGDVPCSFPHAHTRLRRTTCNFFNHPQPVSCSSMAPEPGLCCVTSRRAVIMHD